LHEVTTSLRVSPRVGFGSEWVFQSYSDAPLNAEIASASSTLGRFPGGTPADYFNFQTGWLELPPGAGCGGCSELPWRPTHPADLEAYLNATQQGSVFVLNQLTSTLNAQLSGLRAFAGAGVPADFLLELGNEMYDATRPDVVTAYPTGDDYSSKMAVWSAALKASFPASLVALVGLANEWDNRTHDWNAQVFGNAERTASVDAATIHLYPGLPALALLPENFPAILAPLFTHLADYAAYTAATIPPRLRLWVTEWGTWGGAVGIENTWLQALWHTAFTALLPILLPRVDIVLPYGAVVGDPAMPAYFNSVFGQVAPPNATVPQGSWQRTPSGHGYALAFSVLSTARQVAGVAFSQNPVLDPAVPGSRALVALLGRGAQGVGDGLLLVNLAAAPASLDLTQLQLTPCPPAAGVLCAATWGPAAINDTVRQNINVLTQLNHSVTRVPSDGLVRVQALSINVVQCVSVC